TASGAQDGDYNISYVGGTLTITPAALTITADNQSMAYGSTLPSLTASYSGFVNGDTAASLSTPPSLSTTATRSNPAGTYPISASGASSPNYTITSVDGTLTITPASTTTVLQASPSAVAFAQPVTLSATVNASTTGSNTPTGSVVFLDQGTPLAT